MFAAAPPPAPVVASNSWYLGDLDPDHLRAVGISDEKLAAAGHLKQAVVVVDAGDPDSVPGSTQLPDHRGLGTANAITRAAASYAVAWTRQPLAPQLILVVATSNFGKHVDADHGAAWGRITDEVQDAAPQADVRGGLDAEPDYGTPDDTLAWLQGYKTATLRPFVDLGDCACTAGQALPGKWTLAERGDIASSGSVLPQQYRTSGIDAKRWARLDAATGHHLTFLGVLTETRACAGPPVRSCASIDQTPSVALASLTAALKRPAGLATDIGYLAPLPPRPPHGHPLLEGIAGVLAALVIGGGAYGFRRRRNRVGSAH